MNLTTARKAAKTPEDFETRELHDALDFIVNDERFSELQVSSMQARIEEVLNARKSVGGRTYPKHTPISAITHFDRSTKVVFECMIHPESQWMSKQPSCSQWFMASDSTVECDCKISDSVWWTSFEYINNER